MTVISIETDDQRYVEDVNQYFWECVHTLRRKLKTTVSTSVENWYSLLAV